MLSTNTNFDTKHAYDYKTPMYLIHFNGETIDYCNHTPGTPTNTLKQYLIKISGLAQKVTPEEGQASIGGVAVEILDYNDEITALLATDSYYFHRKKITIKAGYAGMAEADMLTIFTGWVTGLKLNSDLLSYIFDVTDPQKWMQRKIFRNATSAAPVTIQGNPLNILLAILTSTGAGTNGSYDWYAAVNGLGLDTSYVNVTAIEQLRDRWYPGDSHYMTFTIKDREQAKDFLEREIFKVLNCYPVIDGQGFFSIKPFKPPLAALETVQSFNEDNIIGVPAWDANLPALINEVEIFYDHNATTDEFDSELYYIDSTSINNRGPGKKPLTIKSKGLHSSGLGSQPDRTGDIITSRKNKVFGRFSTPPIELGFNAWFSRWLSEAGDIVPFTHRLVPDIEVGTRGYSAERMEVISRDVNWTKGQVKLKLLNTGFGKTIYAVISPIMTVTVGTSATQFTVSVADAAKYTAGWEADIFDAGMRSQATNITILTIDTATGVITCDDIGATPSAGWKIQFATYLNLTAAQQLYWAARAAGAHAITP